MKNNTNVKSSGHSCPLLLMALVDAHARGVSINTQATSSSNGLPAISRARAPAPHLGRVFFL